MNAPTLNPPGQSEELDNGEVLIGCGFYFPRNHPGIHEAALDSPMLLQMACAGLQWALKAAGVNSDELSAAGDLCDGAILFHTRKKERALGILRECRKHELLPLFMCIAWKDAREGAWRIVEHGSYMIQFDEFITAQRQEIRNARMQTALSAVQMMRTIPVQPFDNPPQ